MILYRMKILGTKIRQIMVFNKDITNKYRFARRGGAQSVIPSRPSEFC